MQMKLQKKRNIRTDFKKKTNERTEEKVETKESLRWQFYAYFVHPFLFDVLFVTLSKMFTFAIFATTVQFTKKNTKGLWSDKNVNDLFCTVYGTLSLRSSASLKQIEMTVLYKWKCILWAAMLRMAHLLHLLDALSLND